VISEGIMRRPGNSSASRAILLLMGLVMAISLLACRAAALAYERKPDEIVIYADIQPYPVAPAPEQECLARFVPRLRVWGNGLVYLDISSARQDPPWQWTGRLDHDQIRDLLSFLDTQGFFNNWEGEPPDETAKACRLGANTLQKSVEYTVGRMEPVLYTQLVERIKPALRPLIPQDTHDPRIDSILSAHDPCGKDE
jgi:hypothetical protein